MTQIDETHDPRRRSWVEGADGHPDFPVQNLPFGVFSAPGRSPRGGVAIGDMILDLQAALEAGLLRGDAAEAARLAAGQTLNAFLAAGGGSRRTLRRALSELLSQGGEGSRAAQAAAARILVPAAEATMHLPAAVGDFTDFNAGIHHAIRSGRQLQSRKGSLGYLESYEKDPLLPNYRNLPIAYHGRASSVVVSGHNPRRPWGQVLDPATGKPELRPTRMMDYELEMGIWIGPGNDLGAPVSIAGAADQIAGLSLVNDWSARDIHRWEGVRLGPLTGKNFCTSISPWVVTAEALAPFRTAQKPRGEGEPAILPHLFDAEDQAQGMFSIDLESSIVTPAMRARGEPPLRLARSAMANLYWTPAQMIAHHTASGCNLRPGDLLATGTVSGPDDDGRACFTEASWGGTESVALGNGESRFFLEDGDEVVLRGFAHKEGAVGIGFGECRGRVESNVNYPT